MSPQRCSMCNDNLCENNRQLVLGHIANRNPPADELGEGALQPGNGDQSGTDVRRSVSAPERISNSQEAEPKTDDQFCDDFLKNYGGCIRDTFSLLDFNVVNRMLEEAQNPYYLYLEKSPSPEPVCEDAGPPWLTSPKIEVVPPADQGTVADSPRRGGREPGRLDRSRRSRSKSQKARSLLGKIAHGLVRLKRRVSTKRAPPSPSAPADQPSTSSQQPPQPQPQQPPQPQTQLPTEEEQDAQSLWDAFKALLDFAVTARTGTNIEKLKAAADELNAHANVLRLPLHGNPNMAILCSKCAEGSGQPGSSGNTVAVGSERIRVRAERSELTHGNGGAGTNDNNVAVSNAPGEAQNNEQPAGSSGTAKQAQAARGNGGAGYNEQPSTGNYQLDEEFQFNPKIEDTQ